MSNCLTYDMKNGRFIDTRSDICVLDTPKVFYTFDDYDITIVEKR